MGIEMREILLNPFSRKLVILSFFIVSFASLTYQVVWLRLLIKIFGSSVYAVSTLLTSFMAGLAIGSFVIGIHIDKNEDTLEFYGVLLYTIGAIGFITNYGFEVLYSLSVIFFEILKNSFLLNEIQFILAFLVMIVPTSLIGGVFPVVNKLLVKGSIGRDVGLIYSANNIAAGLGSIISGFIFLSFFGIYKTILLVSFLLFASGIILLFHAREKDGIGS